MKLPSLLRSLPLALLGVALAPQARAADLVYYQDWQEADAFNPNRWTTTGSCITYSRDPNALPPDPGMSVPDAPECSGRHLRETIGWSGGRVMSRTPIPAANGDRFCVTSWIRASGDAAPFIGINYVRDANPAGFPDNQGSVGGCFNGEHYLIGSVAGFDDSAGRTASCPAQPLNHTCCGRSLTGYGLITPVTANGQWGFYSKEFTVQPTDVTVGGNTVNTGSYPRFVLKVQNFSGTQNCDAPGAPPRGPADFDDIRVYKLGAGEACPTAAEVLEQGDDAHQSCTGTTAFCRSREVNIEVAGQARAYAQTYCTGCDGSYGDVGASTCGESSPGCHADGSCGDCDADFGVEGAERPCGADHPVCNLNPGGHGRCGSCAGPADCQDAVGIDRAGPNCVANVCTPTCAVGDDGTSPECGSNRFCGGGDDSGCFPKLANGAQLPERQEDDAASGLCRLAADGAPVTASIFCASGICSKADNRCGLVDGEECTPSDGAAQCRAGRCGADDRCGLLPAARGCLNDVQCRGDSTCEDGVCSGSLPDCDDDSDCGTANFVCDQGQCALGCRGEGGNGCANGRLCSSTDNSIGTCGDVPSSSGGSSSGGPSSGGPGSSSGGAGPGTPEPEGPGGTDGPNADGDTGEDGGCGCHTQSGADVSTLLIAVGVVLGSLRRKRAS